MKKIKDGTVPLTLLILLGLLLPHAVLGQMADEKSARKAQRDSVRNSRNFRWSVLGGPGYTPDFGVLLGVSGLFTLKMNPQDTLQKRSVIPINLAILLSGGVNTAVRPQLFFKEDKFRIFGTLSLKNSYDNYYGVGFDTNKEVERGKETTRFYASGFQINPTFYFRMGASNFFMGPWIDLYQDNWKSVADGIQADPHYLSMGGTGDGLKVFNVGLGAELSYDTRDIPANAYSGARFSLAGGYYSKAFGGDHNYGSVSLDYRQFVELKFLGNRRTLGWTLQSSNTFGDVPISQMPGVGSPFDLRGFYKGHFRDKSTTFGLLEYRHMVNTDRSSGWKRLANRFGFATWAGLGIMGPDFATVEGVLPNFGAGLRIEVQPRMNFRLDIGYDPINKNSLFYLNMTEAF